MIRITLKPELSRGEGRSTIMKKNIFSRSCCLILYVLLLAFALLLSSCTKAADRGDDGRIAKLAMSTASMWMIEKHKHEIEEGLEKGDLDEALEEAEELVPWIEGTPWLHELMPYSKKSADAVKEVVVRLKAKDKEGAKAALKEMEMQFHHIHHELMEIVGDEKHGGNHH